MKYLHIALYVIATVALYYSVHRMHNMLEENLTWGARPGRIMYEEHMQ
jgi:hypothetical protein